MLITNAASVTVLDVRNFGVVSQPCMDYGPRASSPQEFTSLAPQEMQDEEFDFHILHSTHVVTSHITVILLWMRKRCVKRLWL